MSFLESSADIYGDDGIIPVCLSVTRWTAHERKEPESLGLFIPATSLLNVATILMLLEVFKNIRPFFTFNH